MIPARSYMFLVKVLCSTFWRYKYLHSTTTNIQYIYIFWISKRFLFCSISPRVSVVVGNWRASYGPKLERLGFPWWRVRYVTAVQQSVPPAKIFASFSSQMGFSPASRRSDVCTACPPTTVPLWLDWLHHSSHIFLLSFNLPVQPSPVQPSCCERMWQFVRLRVFTWLLENQHK